MAKEKKQGFDAEGFLENYRKDIVTPIRSSQEAVPTESPPENIDAAIEIPDSVSEQVPTPKQRRKTLKTEIEKRSDVKSGIEFSEREVDFIDEFLIERPSSGYSKSGKQVAISKEFHNKISVITTLIGDGITFGGYVENILRKHFDEYENVIKCLLSKSSKL